MEMPFLEVPCPGILYIHPFEVVFYHASVYCLARKEMGMISFDLFKHPAEPVCQLNILLTVNMFLKFVSFTCRAAGQWVVHNMIDEKIIFLLIVKAGLS